MTDCVNFASVSRSSTTKQSYITSGDFIVLQQHNCDDAHLAIDNATSSSLGHVLLNNESQIHTSLGMGSGNPAVDTSNSNTGGGYTPMKVCFATEQSRGDSADDYAILDEEFLLASQPTFKPIRFKAGAEVQIQVANDRRNAAIIWTSAENCENLGNLWVASTTKTMLSQRSGYPQPIFFYNNPFPVTGSWHTCYKPTTVCAAVVLHWLIWLICDFMLLPYAWLGYSERCLGCRMQIGTSFTGQISR